MGFRFGESLEDAGGYGLFRRLVFLETEIQGNPATGLTRTSGTPESADSQKIDPEPERFAKETLVMWKQNSSGKVVGTFIRHLNLCI